MLIELFSIIGAFPFLITPQFCLLEKPLICPLEKQAVQMVDNPVNELNIAQSEEYATLNESQQGNTPTEEQYTIPNQPEYYGNARMDKYNFEEMFKKYFGKEWREAMMVAECESGFNPSAYNADCDCYGLMQIKWYPNRSVNPQDLFDPEINLQVAKQIRDEQGWSPWSCSLVRINN